MAKAKGKTHFVCQECGAATPKWQGKCPSCGSWNSLIEERVVTTSSRDAVMRPRHTTQTLPLSKISAENMPRKQINSHEFNRVLGGGLVPGSVVLVGGDPGIGKSTLLLQEAATLSTENYKILYITGEESAEQIKMRADRLHAVSDFLYILPETEIESALNAIERIDPKLVIVDSIQTMYTSLLESAPGSVSQVRECTLKLIQLAKTRALPVFLVGHVTKEGYLAGPKVLEHMVDTLLLFEGDRDHFYRILRSVKNRFGSTREIGVFEMTENGLKDVPNPSAVFLAERQIKTSGSAVICCMEGTRPILVEVQALATATKYGYPQRTTTGMDVKRLILLLGVLEKRLGYHVGSMDVFLNAVGGLRIDEPAADLGVITSIASSVRNREIDPNTIFIAEVGLGGELRSVSHIEARLREAEKLGFQRAIIPKGNAKGLREFNNLTVIYAATAFEALQNAVQ
ncbi:DNA repair protein RadA [candidate division KSB1 bacterium]|nr:DNA repair protein RadA [candidate division KSB1 bacterium]RQW07012.1 MAG: DNA repair protein RadA [candidate division KSB1 bacterium]